MRNHWSANTPRGQSPSFDISGTTEYAQRVSYLLFVVLLLLANALPAIADTNLLSSGRWAVDGVTAPATNAAVISVAVGKTASPLTVSELKFFYNFDGVNLVQIFSITGAGLLQPALPPPGEVGGSFQLGRYQDCELGLTGPMAVTNLVLPVQVKKNGILQLSGGLANGTSLRSRIFTLKFFPPQSDLVRVDVRCRLVATRNFCVDQTAAAEQDKFRAVTLAANYLSATNADNDLFRYVRTTEKTCFGLWGCYVRHQSACVNLANHPPGYLINTPHPLGNPWLLLAHTTTVPWNSPSLQVAIRSPAGIRPQGFLAEPTVEFWGNWGRVRKSYKTGQSVLALNCSLEALAPRPIGCDWVQP